MTPGSQNGNPGFNLGYWRYGDDPVESFSKAAADARGMADLAREFGIAAGFHKHARYAGLAGWDACAVLEGLDPRVDRVLLRC